MKLYTAAATLALAATLAHASPAVAGPRSAPKCETKYETERCDFGKVGGLRLTVHKTLGIEPASAGYMYAEGDGPENWPAELMETGVIFFEGTGGGFSTDGGLVLEIPGQPRWYRRDNNTTPEWSCGALVCGGWSTPWMVAVDFATLEAMANAPGPTLANGFKIKPEQARAWVEALRARGFR